MKANRGYGDNEDITERKQIEEASKEVKKVQRVFELSPIASGIHDHDGKLIERTGNVLSFRD